MDRERNEGDACRKVVSDKLSLETATRMDP